MDFIFVDFDKILDKFINCFGTFWGNYFLPTLPSRCGSFLFVRDGCHELNRLLILKTYHM